LNGILIIDKPVGITSHDVVARVRRILKTKRVGHTGTLDPFATGVMVILVGQATRLAQFLDKDEKEYVALVRFGFETDTGDRTGERREGETAKPGDAVTPAEIEAVLGEFRGEIEQVPPMYSAKKIDGQKLYELARKGETVERKAVKVTIAELELKGEPPALAGGLNVEHESEPTVNLGLRPRANAGGSPFAAIRVVCSAGTYIRTLAEDIGRKLGTGAHLQELRRTRAGRFPIGQSVTLDELAESAEPASLLIPVEEAVSHLSRFDVVADRVAKTRSGLSSRVYQPQFQHGEPVAMLDPEQRLIAIGLFDADQSVVQPKIVLAD
jgi:tRNA pseudouridine55 synthase